MKFCSKGYVLPCEGTPVVILVSCLCQIPVMVGASAFERAEGLGDMASIILSYFSYVQFVVYDNAYILF